MWSDTTHTHWSEHTHTASENQNLLCVFTARARGILYSVTWRFTHSARIYQLIHLKNTAHLYLPMISDQSRGASLVTRSEVISWGIITFVGASVACCLQPEWNWCVGNASPCQRWPPPVKPFIIKASKETTKHVCVNLIATLIAYAVL